MDDAAERIRRLPLWSGAIEIEPLSGGLSNTNYRVVDGGHRYVVRIGADLPVHHVRRAQEAAVSQAAHEAGIAPALRLAADGLMVFDHVDGRTFGDADVRGNIDRIIPILRHCHADVGAGVSGIAPFFWVFHVIRDYERTLRAGGSRWADGLGPMLATAKRMEAAQVPLPIVLGHHDLLPANFIDDGKRIWLIDWEYGGFGTALFDAANLTSNAGFQRPDALAVLSAILERPVDAPLARAFDAMGVASLLRETMWAMVSELHLAAPGVDYAAYARENLERYGTALAAYNEIYGDAS